MRITLLLCIALYSPLNSQVLLTLQPGAEEGKDSEIFNLTPNDPLSTDLFRANAWTFSGDNGYQRGLLEFDLQTIPVGSEIYAAHLSLYSPGSPHTQSQSGSNAAFLSRITENWTEGTVTWNTQPTYTPSNQVSLAQSTSAYQDYLDIDVLQLVKDMLSDPNHSYGFMLRQQNETPLRRMAFSSSDYTEAAKHPKLEIRYIPPACKTLVLQPGGTEGKDAEIFSLQPFTNLNHELMRANAWTFSGDLGIERSFFAFDLSSIPANAEINSVYLSLFAPDVPHDQFHSGDNGGIIQRVTSSWNETTVTWDNQPATTDENEIILEATDDAYQDYKNIDVTALVRDMISNPGNSFGFRLQLQDEVQSRRLTFVSSDYANPQKHPRLEICYTEMVSTRPDPPQDQLTLYPNPADQLLYFNSDDSWSNQPVHIQIFDVHARRVINLDDCSDNAIHIGHLSAGMYLVSVSTNDHQHSSIEYFMKY